MQVKTSDAPWNWAKLKEPIKSFLAVLRIAPESHFLLAVSFALRGDIQKLSQHAQLARGEQKRLGNAFKRLCRNVARMAEMHSAFEALFCQVPDYFDATELVQEEITPYVDLADLVEVWIVDPPRRPEPNALRSIRARKRRKQDELLMRAQRAFRDLSSSGISVILPQRLHEECSLKHLPLAYSVADPCRIAEELIAVLEAAWSIRDVADFFYFVPVWRKARFIEGAYQVSTTLLAELPVEDDLAVVAREREARGEQPVDLRAGRGKGVGNGDWRGGPVACRGGRKLPSLTRRASNSLTRRAPLAHASDFQFAQASGYQVSVAA